MNRREIPQAFDPSVVFRRHTPARESASRQIIDRILSHLGWIIDERLPDCNVFTEGAKINPQRELLNNKRPDYILYEQGTDRPLAVIEAKRPGSSLTNTNRESVKKYAEPLDVQIVFATNGTLCETFDRRSGGPLRIDGEPVVGLLSPNLLLRFANDGPELASPRTTQQTKQELISIFALANELLRKEGLREGVERFSEFSNLLFLKLISEIEEDRQAKGEVRHLESRYCWEAFASKPAEEMLDYINDTILPRLVNSYNHSGEVFRSQLQISNASILQQIVNALSELSLLDAESDVKGDAFEYFLKHSVTVGNDLGEYFTPRHIVQLIVELVDPGFPETVYDPCCGTGGFLIEAYRHIAQKVVTTPAIRRVLENETIYGRELTGTARIAKMNMILAGDGHTNIRQQDALKEPVHGAYKVVLTNFPFSQKTSYGNFYGLNTEDANLVFLKHALDACKDGGRIGVVVPEGLLFRETSQYRNTRQFLIENFAVEAVIALHNFVFQPYTGQPTAILILTKSRLGKSVWFYEVLEDGYKKTVSKKGRAPNSSGENHLVELRSIWNEKPESERSFAISLDRIRENGFKLSFSSYRPRPEKTGWLPLGGTDGVCKIMIGSTPSTKVQEYWGGEYAYSWVTITDMTKKFVTSTQRSITQLGIRNSRSKRMPEGTVLVSFKLSVGKTAIAGKDLYTNEAIAGLVPKGPQVLPEYLYYLIPSLDLNAYMQPAAKGKTLNKRILEGIRIPVPPINEQEEFVRKMNRLENTVVQLRDKADGEARKMHKAAHDLLEKH